MDVSMIRTVRRQGDIPDGLVPKDPLEFDDDACFPLTCQDVIPLCNGIQFSSFEIMAMYASEEFDTTEFPGCEEPGTEITCRKFNRADGTFTPNFKALVVERHMNRALLGIDLPFYHVRPLNDSQKLVTIYPFLLEIVEQELPCPPEIFIEMGIIASIRPRDIISELQSLIAKMKCCLVKELVVDGDGARAWEWSPATIESDWAGPLMVRYGEGYRAHLKHGNELVHAIWAVPNTEQAHKILRERGEPIAEPIGKESAE